MGLTNNLGKLSNMITSTGSAVGIAQSSPSYTLDVTGTGRYTSTLDATNTFTLTGTQPNNIINYTDATSYARFYFTEGSTYKGTIQFIGSNFVASSRRNNLEIVNSTTGDIAIGTGDARTFFIKNGGNVGIGTSSPISYSNKATLGIQGAWGGQLDIMVGSTSHAQFGSDNYDSGLSCRIQSQDGIVFKTNGASERLRITSGGSVFINTTTDYGGKLQVNGGIYSIGSASGFSFIDRTNLNFITWYSSGNLTYLNNSSTGNILQINNSTGVYTPLSDINKKKDFEDSTIGLSAILGLKPTLYRMKTDSEDSNKQLGFIAQEVKEFIPQAFVESEDFIGLNYNAITATLVKAIQEQQAQIEELKLKIK